MSSAATATVVLTHKNINFPREQQWNVLSARVIRVCEVNCLCDERGDRLSKEIFWLIVFATNQ